MNEKPHTRPAVNMSGRTLSGCSALTSTFLGRPRFRLTGWSPSAGVLGGASSADSGGESTLRLPAGMRMLNLSTSSSSFSAMDLRGRPFRCAGPLKTASSAASTRRTDMTGFDRCELSGRRSFAIVPSLTMSFKMSQKNCQSVPDPTKRNWVLLYPCNA